jgi:hypothetical protein
MNLLDYLKLTGMGAPASTAPDASTYLAYMGQGGDLSDMGGDDPVSAPGNVYPYAPGSTNSALVPDSTTSLPQPQTSGAPVSTPSTPGIWDRIKSGLSQPGAAQTLLAMGASMLDQGGPQERPVGTGQAIGRSLNAGLSTFDQYRQRQALDQYHSTVAGARQTQAQADLQRALNDAADKAGKAPVVQRIESGDQIITQQMDPSDGSWHTIATAPRFEAKTPPQPTNASVIAPILGKIAAGQPLTAGEQKALDTYKSISPIDQLMQQELGGGSPSVQTPAPTPVQPAPQASVAPVQPNPRPQVPTVQRPAPQAAAAGSYTTLAGRKVSGMTARYSQIQDAKTLVSKGADKNAVRQRLISYGIDPAAAGL